MKKTINVPKPLAYLVLFFLSILFFTVPYYYKQRQSTGIFYTDMYLIWLVGCLCFLYNTLVVKIAFKTIPIMGIICCLYILALFLSKSFQDSNSINALITLFSCINIFYFLKIVKKSPLYFIPILAILFSYLFQIYIGYRQAIESGFESLAIRGWIYNSGFFGNYLVSMLPLVFTGAVTPKNFKPKLRIVLSVLFITIAILLSFTIARAAIIGAAFGCVFVLWPFIKHNVQKYRLLSLFIGIAIIVITAIQLYKLKPASASGRFIIYRISLNIIKDHFLFGVGPNRFSAVYNNYQAAYFQQEKSSIQTELQSDNTYEAFNSIMQIIVECGVVGFMLLLLFVYQLFKSQKKLKPETNSKWLYNGSKGCIVSIIIASLFSNPFHVTPILLIFCYHLSIIFPNTDTAKYARPYSILKFLFAFIITLYIGIYGINQHKAEISWNEAHDLSIYYGFNDAKKGYEKTYPYLKHNGDFLFNYGAEASLAKKHALAIILLNQSTKYISTSNIFLYLGDSYAGINEFELAERNYLHSIYIAPSHIYPKYQLVQLYKKWGKSKQVIFWVNKALQMPIKVPTPFVEQLITELKRDI